MRGWLGVEPRHLTALVAVHRERSFRAAAMELGLVQSAVSQRIAQLEELVGSPLFERSRGQSDVRLTDAGRVLIDHAEQIIAEFDAALVDLRALMSGPVPTLKVGAYESVASCIVPPALKQLGDAAGEPALNVVLHEDTEWRRFFPRVSSGDLDAAFGELPLDPGPFEYRELIHDPCVLLVAADSPLAGRERPPTLAEIGALPLIAPSWPMLKLIVEHLRAAGVDPDFVFTSQANSGVQDLVAHRVGSALIPLLAVNRTDPRVAVVPLGNILPSRRIALYWHRDRKETSALMRFLAALEASIGVQPGASTTDPVSELPAAA